MSVIEGATNTIKQSIAIKQEKLAIMKDKHRQLSLVIPRIEHEIEVEKKRLAEVMGSETTESQSCPIRYNPPLSPHDTSIL